MLSDDLMSMRMWHHESGGQRALAKGSTQSWKERTRSMSSCDVLGDLEGPLFKHRPLPTGLCSNQCSSSRSQMISAHCVDSRSRPQRGAIQIPFPCLAPNADSARARSDSPQGPLKSPNMVFDVHAASLSPSRPGISFKHKDVLDLSNPLAFFSSASNCPEGRGRGGRAGLLSLNSGSGRRENLATSSPCENETSTISPMIFLPHSATAPSTAASSNSKSRLSSFLEAPADPSRAVSPVFHFAGGLPARASSSSRRGTQKAGSFQELGSLRPFDCGAAGFVGEITGDVPLLSRTGACVPILPSVTPPRTPQSAAGPLNPTLFHALSSSYCTQARSPATVPGATVPVSNRRLVRRSSYGGMEWWHTEQEQRQRATSGGRSTVGDVNSETVEMSMSQYLGMLDSSLAEKPVLGAHEHTPSNAKHGGSGMLMPRHVFHEELSCFSTDSSPFRGRRRHSRNSSTSARRVSLQVDVDVGHNNIGSVFSGTTQDSGGIGKTPPTLFMQQGRHHTASAKSSTGTPTRSSTGTPTRSSTGTTSSTPWSEAEGVSSPMLRRSGSRRASACASPLGWQGSPGSVLEEGVLLLPGQDEMGGHGPLPGLMCPKGAPRLRADVAEQQPLSVCNLEQMRTGGSGVRSGPIGVSKAMSWNEERVMRHAREHMPTEDKDPEDRSNPFTWKELEESCRRLDDANIRIAGIDLTDVATTSEGDHANASNSACYLPHGHADVAPEGGDHDVMLLSPATAATQKCGMPWELLPKSPTSMASPVASPGSPSVGSSKGQGSPGEASPRKVLVNRVLGRVRKQWESLHGSTRFLSRHSSAHM